jgi:3-methylcrotonyl-CoA carboxylase alpha subunit
VLADAHGHCVHLFERDCSIQRRHQKVFEETPCPVLAPETRAAMGAVAVKAAQAVGYVGAGTCEFLYDSRDASFYFLEMNTRLQVEHPITELITGVDLARAQLRIAAGEPLWFSQDDLHVHGHAVECRIYAEDPQANFRPAPGPLPGYREPGGPFVRVDSGVVEGSEVPIHYDPMVSKLVVWGRDRDEALTRCRRALLEYRIVGIPTSIPFFLALFEDGAFRSGRYDTGFITADWLAEKLAPPAELAREVAVAAAIARFEADSARRPDGGGDESSPGKRPIRWRHMMIYEVTVGDVVHRVEVRKGRDGYVVRVDDGAEESVAARRSGPAEWRVAGSSLGLFLRGDDFDAQLHGHAIRGRVVDPRQDAFSHAASGHDGEVVTQMPGSVVRILVEPGATVTKGQVVVIVEAMKMENEFKAPADGVVSAVPVRVGQAVESGTTLMVIGS